MLLLEELLGLLLDSLLIRHHLRLVQMLRLVGSLRAAILVRGLHDVEVHSELGLLGGQRYLLALRCVLRLLWRERELDPTALSLLASAVLRYGCRGTLALDSCTLPSACVGSLEGTCDVLRALLALLRDRLPSEGVDLVVIQPACRRLEV